MSTSSYPETETCHDCGVEYPYPVSYHHTDEECANAVRLAKGATLLFAIHLPREQHRFSTVHEGNGHYLRCACGVDVSTYHGADQHLNGVLWEEVKRLQAENERLRAAATIAREFVRYHPAVKGQWPMVVGVLDEALKVTQTEAKP